MFAREMLLVFEVCSLLKCKCVQEMVSNDLLQTLDTHARIRKDYCICIYVKQ